MRRTVSLSAELQIIMEVLEAVRTVAEQFREPMTSAPAKIEAVRSVLMVAIERIRLLDRVVRGSVDARFLWCHENAALPVSARDDGDHLLTSWSNREALRHHKREVKGAKKRIAHQRAKRALPRSLP